MQVAPRGGVSKITETAAHEKATAFRAGPKFIGSAWRRLNWRPHRVCASFDRLERANARFRQSAARRILAPIKVSAKVALRLPRARQFIQIPMTDGASYIAD